MPSEAIIVDRRDLACLLPSTAFHPLAGNSFRMGEAQVVIAARVSERSSILEHLSSHSRKEQLDGTLHPITFQRHRSKHRMVGKRMRSFHPTEDPTSYACGPMSSGKHHVMERPHRLEGGRDHPGGPDTFQRQLSEASEHLETR